MQCGAPVSTLSPMPSLCSLHLSGHEGITLKLWGGVKTSHMQVSFKSEWNRSPNLLSSAPAKQLSHLLLVSVWNEWSPLAFFHLYKRNSSQVYSEWRRTGGSQPEPGTICPWGHLCSHGTGLVLYVRHRGLARCLRRPPPSLKSQELNTTNQKALK